MILPAGLDSLRPLLGSLPVSLVAADMDGIVFVWNAHAENMYGWSADDAIGRPLRELIVSSTNAEAPDTVVERLRRGESWEGEYRLLNRAGAEFTVHVIDTPLFAADGTPQGFLGLAVHVSRDREASIAVLKAVVEHSPISVTVVGGDDRIVLTLGDNRTGQEVKDSYRGRKISDVVADPSYVAMAKRVRLGERGRQTITFGARSYDVTGVPLPDSVAGPGSAAFVATDITDRISESRRFQALVENLDEVTAILDAEGTLRYISPAIEGVIGYTPVEVMQDVSVTHMHPDDVERSNEAFATALEQPGVLVAHSYRLRHRDGTWRDVEQTIVNRLNDPSIGGLVAVGRDVTMRLAAERGLHAANQRLHDVNGDLVALNRIHAVLSEAGTAMVRSSEPMALLDEVCRILVTTGGFAAAAFTTAASTSGEVKVLATRNDEMAPLAATAVVSAIVTKVREGWPRRAGRPGSPVLFPVERRDGEPGILALCAKAGVGALSAAERGILLGLTRDLAFALDAMSSNKLRAAATAAAARRAQQHAMVSRLGRLAMTADVSQVLEAAVDTLASFELQHVILFEPLPDGASVVVRAVAGGTAPMSRGDIVPRSMVPIADGVLTSGSPISVGDVSSEPHYRLAPDAPFACVGSAVGVPVRVRDQTVSVLLIRSFAPNVFDVRDVAFYESTANVVGAAMERYQHETELRHDATHDRRTGLPNRTLLGDRLTQALARYRRRRSGHVAVLVVDMDGFKAVNDHTGRDAGDQLLALAGGRLTEATRPSDTVAASAGDEFVVLCEDLTDPAEAAAVASRIVERMRAPFAVGGRDVTVTVSVGIAVGSAEATVAGLLHDADVAMYRAKERGKDRYEIFDETLRVQVAQREDIEVGLRRALDRGEFVVAYQPVVDLVSGQIGEAEALLRWTRHDGTQVSPAEFIPIAEDTGLIVAIGAWVLQRACEDAVRWNAQLHGAPVSVAVNLSARQISHPDLVPTVVRTLAATGLAPSLLRLEITETALMEEGDGVATLQALDDLGVQLSVDDFGTGYSSLMYLRRYPVRLLKVDRYFIAGLGKNAEDEAISVAVISLAHALGLMATAEGVETVEQLERLRSLGCDYGQGYLWSRAVPYADFLLVIEALRSSASDPVAVPVCAERREPRRPAAVAAGATTVVLVDDSPSDRGLLRLALEDAGVFTIVGEAANGEEAITLAGETQPDVVVLDMSMTGMNGLEAVGPIHAVSPATHVVFLSGFLSGALAQAAMHAGGYMQFDKSVPVERVVAQLAAALAGDIDRDAGAPRVRVPAA